MDITHEDKHTGFKNSVTLTVSLCLTYTLCIAAVRVWIRKGAFGSDDTIIAVATVVALSHTACDYASLANGLGLPWERLEGSNTLHRLDQTSIAGVVLFIVALYLSKCAMLAFLCRVTRSAQQLSFYHICNAVIAALGFISVLVATVDCSTVSGFYWAFYVNQSSCFNQSQRWQAITALDLMTEIILLALPVQLIWGLQMPTTKKFMLILAFFLRLPALGLSIGRNYYTIQLAKSTTDAGLHAAIVVIWLEVQLSYALAASTLSALKTFTESFNSGFGQGFTRGKSDSSYQVSNPSGFSSSRTEKCSLADDRSRSVSSSGKSLVKKSSDIDLEAHPLPSPSKTFEQWRSLSDIAPQVDSSTMMTMSTADEKYPHRSCRELNSPDSEISTASTVVAQVQRSIYNKLAHADHKPFPAP